MRATDELFDYFKGKISSIELLSSSGGVFEVNANGKKIYSKKVTGEFPDTKILIEEIEKII